MKCTSKEQESCDVEKLGCEGCYYNEKTIDLCANCKVIAERDKLKKIVDLMAEQLSTPVNSKEFIKNYYKEKVKWKNG